ncbi:MAG: 50S ribosomal protein L11 methyltransferase [Cyclobacteriaceae bacterium]|nr:50S ribosomal protein L11 methyltransferase [Cyclobacteriaceae bacterium]
MADYKEITVSCKPDFIEILIAEFAAIGFDTFQENESGFTTFVEGEFDAAIIDQVAEQYGVVASFNYSTKDVEKQNWNEEWEKHYEPIVVEEKCIVKAPFHQDVPTYPIELLITPKMSFGTGHHETTYLMLAEMLEMDFHASNVMDAGTGTGVLAILAKKRGAQHVFAFDVDDWCVENTMENAELNHVELHVIKASIEGIEQQPEYDVLLANINKNVLLSQMNYYAGVLRQGGDMLLSGFYTEDIEDIKEQAHQEGFVFEKKRERNNWSMLRFKKVGE